MKLWLNGSTLIAYVRRSQRNSSSGMGLESCGCFINNLKSVPLSFAGILTLRSA